MFQLQIQYLLINHTITPTFDTLALVLLLQDDDEFSHLEDEEEFENFAKDSAPVDRDGRPSASQQLRFADVRVLGFMIFVGIHAVCLNQFGIGHGLLLYENSGARPSAQQLD